MKDRKDYKTVVSHPFHVFNGIFLTLPLDGIRQTGLRVPLLQENCDLGLANSKEPSEILEEFFKSQGLNTQQEQADLLFRIIQYVERQVVLVDALEDARYAQLNDLGGVESLQSFMQRIRRHGKEEELKEILGDYAVRVVLTAHPTQFYPGNALAIITDLAKAMENNDLVSIRKLLHQLGLTPFFQSEPPSPYDEAVRQSWYLENVFYHAVPELYARVAQALDDASALSLSEQLISIGFWPGGDRDGNPFVDSKTTWHVAERLRATLLRCYRREIRDLRRHITFKHVSSQLDLLQDQIEFAMLHPDDQRLSVVSLTERLEEVAEWVAKHSNGLYLSKIRGFQFKLRLFGLHFASLDIRQDSRVIQSALRTALSSGGDALNVFEEMTQSEKIEFLMNSDLPSDVTGLGEERHQDVIDSLRVMMRIQEQNGPRACQRFIISNCRGMIDIAAVIGLARMAGVWQKMELDVVPLFETIDDLANAESEMQLMYAHATYRKHLTTRAEKQTVMLGFSDGTKDGGYLQANWSIYQAKRRLTELSRAAGVTVLFFDGRGGPPARGGGNTHRFYASLGSDIENTEIQTTIQGQTISSNFGIPKSAGFNLELLLTAGLQSRLFDDKQTELSDEQSDLMEELGRLSHGHYEELKAHPQFMPYLSNRGTLKYYGETNIGSRPTSRAKEGELTFGDLRAIPFVGSWTQLKQNVPGFFGLGYALAHLDSMDRLDEAAELYANNAFFRALVENSMQSMVKSDFRLTAHLENDERFGGIWTTIREEFIRTKRYVLQISGQKELMERNQHIKESIALRDGIIRPLLVIQHFALGEIDRSQGKGDWDDEVLKRLVVRSMFGIINASRNAV
ncbi:MAG: phosphoenolpyruvate carboxylase [Crocinitomicaceae bacterium]|nr:phosphoenolpyruvate carboxylase [Crocinitomicaceae bacterium]